MNLTSLVGRLWKKRRKIKGYLEREIRLRVHGEAKLPVIHIDHVEGGRRIPLAPQLYDPEKNSPQQRDDFEILIIPKARVWPDTSAAAVNGSFVNETLINQLPKEGHYTDRYTRDYPVFEIRGNVANIGHVFINYYNRIIESILRIYCLKHHQLESIKIRLAVDDRFTRDEIDFIKHLIPGHVEVVEVGAYKTLYVDNYIFIPRLANKPGARKNVITSPGFVPTEALDWLREEGRRFAEQHAPRHYGDKIFVTRPVTPKRNISNLAEIEAYLSGEGFEIVDPARMSLAEQIHCFAGARLIVAQHGAALTNLVFSEDVKVIELHAPESNHFPFRKFCEVRGFPYEGIELEMPPGGFSKQQQKMRPKDRDGYLSLATLRAKLDAL